MLSGPIARATVNSSVVLGFRLLAQVGTLLIVARVLGPAQFGAFAGMAAFAVTLGALSTFGTHLLLLRDVSTDPELGAKFLPVALSTTLLCGAVLFLIYLLLTVFWLKPDGVRFAMLVAVGLSDILLLPFLSIPSVIWQGRGMIARSQMLFALPQGLRLLAALIVAALSPQDALVVYAYAYALAALLSLLVGIRALDQSLTRIFLWRLPTSGEWREASSFAALNLTALGPNELDKTLAVHFLTATAAGTYAAGSRVLGPLALPVLAMMLAALPRLFREQADGTRSYRLMRISLFLALCYGLLASGSLWLCAPVIAGLFGEQYSGLTETLRWLTLAVPGMTLRCVLNSALMTAGHTWLRVGVELVGLLVLCGSVLAMMHLGSTGMALAVACAEWSMVGLGLLSLRSLSLNRHPVV